MSVEVHRQRSGTAWRSMLIRAGKLRIGACAWADYAIFTISWGYWHRSLELGWKGYVHGLRVLP